MTRDPDSPPPRRRRHKLGRPPCAGGAEALLGVGVVGGGENGSTRELGIGQLEVAVLDRTRIGRAFRRLAGPALTGLLEGGMPSP